MRCWVLGAVLLAASGATSVSAQDDCAVGSAKPMVSAITPVVGQSPLWATTGIGAIAWAGPDKPVGVLWVRDLSVVGPGFITGQLKGTPATKVRFTTRGSTLGVKEERYRFDGLGMKPAKVTQADLQKYGFYQTDVWFPAAGCYEITGRVGRQQSVIYFRVAQKTGK